MAKASPQSSLRQSFKASLSSSQGFGLWLQLQLWLDTVYQLFPMQTSSWPWHRELEPFSLTWNSGGQRGVCVGGESPLLSQSGSPSARPPSAPWAAFLAPVSFVLPDTWGPPKSGPRGWGLRPQSPGELRAAGKGCSAPTVQQDCSTHADSASIEIGPVTCFYFSF